MVGRWRCTFPSIHLFRLKIAVGCLTSTYLCIRCVVCCVVCVCGVLWWCCVVWCGGVVCVSFLSFFSQFSPFSFLSLFSLSSLLFSLSSLLFSPPNTVKHWSTNTASNFEAFECDMANDKCTFTASLPPPPLPPPCLPLPPRKKKGGNFSLQGYFRRLIFLKITVFN